VKPISIEIKEPLAGRVLTVNDSASGRFLIEIPMHAYARCLAKCDEKSPDYALLKNGIVVRDDPHKAIVQVRCNADEAGVIRRILVEQCPEVLDELHISPDFASS